MLAFVGMYRSNARKTLCAFKASTGQLLCRRKRVMAAGGEKKQTNTEFPNFKRGFVK